MHVELTGHFSNKYTCLCNWVKYQTKRLKWDDDGERKGIVWVMQKVFGLDETHLLYVSDENEGRYILDKIMTGDNFGYYDERLKT